MSMTLRQCMSQQARPFDDYRKLLTALARTDKPADAGGMPLASLARALHRTVDDVEDDLGIVRYCVGVLPRLQAAFETLERTRKAVIDPATATDEKTRLRSVGQDDEAEMMDREARRLRREFEAASAAWVGLETERAKFDSLSAANPELVGAAQPWQAPPSPSPHAQHVAIFLPDAPVDVEESPPAPPRRGAPRPDMPASCWLLERLYSGELAGHGGTAEVHYFSDAESAAAAVEKLGSHCWSVLTIEQVSERSLADLATNRGIFHVAEPPAGARPLYEDAGYAPPPPPGRVIAQKESW